MSAAAWVRRGFGQGFGRGLWTAASTSFPGSATLPVGAPEPDRARCGVPRVVA
jgi:hypothetical protein